MYKLYEFNVLVKAKLEADMYHFPHIFMVIHLNEFSLIKPK
jgi:hypothetical protein